MRVAYADPPYPGQSAKHYRHHPDYAGEVDHAALLLQLQDYDGWVLHTSSTALRDVLLLCPLNVRLMAWVKPFAAFKKGVYPAYAWEPVIIKAARNHSKWAWDHGAMRDWIAEPISLRGKVHGAKPESVCWWAFEVAGFDPSDNLVDLFPGSGAVTRAWEAWKRYQPLPIQNAFEQPTL